MSELMLIGSLRAPVEHGDPVGLIQLRARAMQAADELERLWEDNDRMRSALRHMVNLFEDGPPNVSDDDCEQAVDAARAVLFGPQGNDGGGLCE